MKMFARMKDDLAGLQRMRGKKIGPWKIQGKVNWVVYGFKGGRSSWVEI